MWIHVYFKWFLEKICMCLMSFFIFPYQNNNMFYPCEFYLVIVPPRSVIYFFYGFVTCLCLVSSCYCLVSDDMFTHYGSPLLPSIYYLVIFGYQLISFYLTSIWVGFTIKVNWVMCRCFVHKASQHWQICFSFYIYILGWVCQPRACRVCDNVILLLCPLHNRRNATSW